MGSPPEDEDKNKQKRPYDLNRLDAKRLAENKRIEESRNRAERDRRIAEERFGDHNQQTQEEAKKALELKQRLDKQKNQDTKRAQDDILLQEQMNVIYVPEGMVPKPKPGAKRHPEPEEYKIFRESLEPEMKKSVQFDESTGQLIFSGPKGLEALEKYLDQNPDAKFGLMCVENNLKSSLTELRNRGLLDKLTSIEVDGRLIQDDELRSRIQKSINWPPRPSPSGTESGYGTSGG